MKMTEPIDRSGVALRGSLRLNEPMGKHVSWRAGGAAARAYTPADRADLAAFLATLPKGEPVCFVGLGSNLLVRDGGYRGTVVLMHSPHGAMHVEGDLIYAEANVACPKLARLAAMHSFEGAGFRAPLPAPVAAPLALNPRASSRPAGSRAMKSVALESPRSTRISSSTRRERRVLRTSRL